MAERTRLGIVVLIAISTLASCGKKCNPSDTEKLVYQEDKCGSDVAKQASPMNDYNVYVASGFPVASGVGIVTKWSKSGDFLSVVHDYASNAGYMPQAIGFQFLGSALQMFMLAYNGTYGEVDVANTDGTSFTQYFANTAAMTAGTRRMAITSDGGYLITRTAGVERFNSAKQRLGAAAKYATGGTCTIAAGISATQIMVAGTDLVIAANAAATPNNKLNLYNGSTGVCIAGAAPAGPATTLWPVDMDYIPSQGKLLVLYYPFTGATSNAQIWSFDVSAVAISNGTLLFNDLNGDIATISATPAALSSSLAYDETAAEKFVMVGTTNNSVLKLLYDGTSLTKASSTPFIYQNSFVKSISSVRVLNQ